MDQPKTDNLSYSRILVFWTPLAVMWILMGIEQPALTAVVARLPDAEVNLAAFGVTFAMALVIESPIIQMLAAGTALPIDRRHYRRLANFMHILAAGLTTLHLLVGVTPLYHFILATVMGVPERIIAPSRTAFLLMTPFAAAVGYRRLWQGVLIRCGRTGVIPLTMVVRILATGTFLTVGFMMKGAGATVAAISMSAGVISGAIAAGVIARRAVRRDLVESSGVDVPSWRALLRFYVPLSLTSIILLASNPALTFGITRSQFALESLAVWPVLNGFMFLFNSVAMSYQEAVIALIDRHPGNGVRLAMFSTMLGIALSSLMIITTVTPLEPLWFHGVSGLQDSLLRFTRPPLYFIAAIPLLLSVKSWLRGTYVRESNTRILAKGTVLYTVTLLLVVSVVPAVVRPTGVVLAGGALLVSHAVENLFLGMSRIRRARSSAARKVGIGNPADATEQ